MQTKDKINQDKIDAERWRALVSSQRIRILGTGSLGKQHQHVSLEIWETYPDVPPSTHGVEVLTTYVDTIRQKT